MDTATIFGLPPSSDLEPYVLAYDLVETGGSSAAIPGVALATHALVFCYGDPVRVRIGERAHVLPTVSIRSVIPTPWSVQGDGALHFVFVHLRPPCLYHLLRESVATLTGQTVDATDAGLKPSPSWVVDALRDAPPRAAAKVAIVERYLRLCLRDVSREASAVVRLSSIPRRLERLAAELRCSERHLRRQFLQYIGVPPKRYHDMLRVEAACTRLTRPQPGNLTELAVDLDFYDLAHLNKTFRRYTGMSPSAFVRRLGVGPVGTFQQPSREDARPAR